MGKRQKSNKPDAVRAAEADSLWNKLLAWGIPMEDLQPLKKVRDDFAQHGIGSSGSLSIPSVPTHTIDYKLTVSPHNVSEIKLAYKYLKSVKSPLGNSTKV